MDLKQTRDLEQVGAPLGGCCCCQLPVAAAASLEPLCNLPLRRVSPESVFAYASCCCVCPVFGPATPLPLRTRLHSPPPLPPSAGYTPPPASTLACFPPPTFLVPTPCSRGAVFAR